MKKKHSTLTLFAACLVTALAVAAAVLFGCYLALGGGEGLRVLGKVNAVRRVVDAQYVGETDWEAVADEAASGMIDALDDRWSYYMTAAQYGDYESRSNNTASGIGVTIQSDEESGGFLILAVSNGSPAQAAGVRAGQIIVGAAGQDVRGLSTDELKAIIQAQEGEFSVRLLNPDGGEEERIVYRDTFYANPVSYELLEGNIGYIAISNFEAGAAENAIAALEALREQGMEALVFDVRSNPGGRLSELIELLDYLLPEGDLFVSVSKDGQEEVFTSDAASVDIPMAVLLNANSYSAAEFFAAALSEYGAAVTVGEASTGKGRSQVTYVLSDGSAVHISTRRYLTPNRVDLSEQGGLTPEIEVPMGTEGDAQLDAALAFLAGATKSPS